MLERDHIMRQINVLSQALARALSLRSARRESEALKELDRAIEDLSDSLEAERPTQVDRLALCVGPDGVLRPFAFDLAALLTLRGDIHHESGQVRRAREEYTDALAIYQAAVEKPPSELPWDLRARMDSVKERLQDAGWSEEPSRD